MSRKTLQDSITADYNPEGINQYSSGGGLAANKSASAALAFAQKAHAATKGKSLPETKSAIKASRQAEKAQRKGNIKEAIKLHQEAAKQHTTASKQYILGPKWHHESAAKLHKDAIKALKEKK